MLRDMSLPDRMATLERSLEKERNKRKVQADTINEMAERLDIVMTFLDGMKRNNPDRRTYTKFVRRELKVPVLEESGDE